MTRIISPMIVNPCMMEISDLREPGHDGHIIKRFADGFLLDTVTFDDPHLIPRCSAGCLLWRRAVQCSGSRMHRGSSLRDPSLNSTKRIIQQICFPYPAHDGQHRSDMVQYRSFDLVPYNPWPGRRLCIDCSALRIETFVEP